MDQNEEWRTIRGYEGTYEVSNLGRVRRVAPRSDWLGVSRPAPNGVAFGTPSMRVLKTSPTTQGYATVHLSLRGSRQTLVVHQLVAAAFCGPQPSRKHGVNHKDGEKTTNRADNLEWVTVRQQLAHARTLHPDQPRWFRSLTTEQAREVLAHPEISTREFAQRFGVNGLVIQRIRRGKTYRWAGPRQPSDTPLELRRWHPCDVTTCGCSCHFT
jgi:hypothetical protein